jgi:SAM-dependent methyltransferase
MGLASPAVEGLVTDPAGGCRFCGTTLRQSFADLGTSPLANSYVNDPAASERFFPLHAYVCEECFLVQLPAAASAEEIFADDYAYFASYSSSWVDHARRYVETAVERFGLGAESSVVEIASNDGYLLQFFVERGIPALGVEPAANVARVAEERGIPTVVRFFGRALAEELRERRPAELLVANNVLAHVPDLNDFVAGIAALVAPEGVATLEFPHLLRLIEETEFDTIYHEHFSYFSFLTAERVFAAHGLELFDVEELPTHGGSLRIYARHAGGEVGAAVAELRERELAAGLGDLALYASFEERVREAKRSLLEFLVEAKREGRSLAAYGAAAKGSTLLNYCGVRTDFVDYVVDRSPHKQGRLLPGTRIPIVAPERVAETRPDYLLVLAWNLVDEIAEQMAHVREWGCRFVTPLPRVRVL